MQTKIIEIILNNFSIVVHYLLQGAFLYLAIFALEINGNFNIE